MNAYETFPRSLPTNLKVAFYRFRGANPSFQQAHPGMDSPDLVVRLKKPSRFPARKTDSNPEYAITSLFDFYVDSDVRTNFTVGNTSNPFLLSQPLNADGLNDPVYQEGAEFSIEDVVLWKENEHPTDLPWTDDLVAALPEVEIPSFFSEAHGNTGIVAAMTVFGELGVILPKEQKCWEPVRFDDPMTKEFKQVSEEAGWLCLPEEQLKPEYPSRIDDGQFDQRTHAFWVGKRCGWCGSSNVKPSFIGEEQCISCYSTEIEDRTTMNLDGLDLE